MLEKESGSSLCARMSLSLLLLVFLLERVCLVSERPTEIWTAEIDFYRFNVYLISGPLNTSLLMDFLTTPEKPESEMYHLSERSHLSEPSSRCYIEAIIRTGPWKPATPSDSKSDTFDSRRYPRTRPYRSRTCSRINIERRLCSRKQR